MIRLTAEDTKDREARNIPICDALYNIFPSMPNRIHGTDESKRVFHFRESGIQGDILRHSLKKACKNAGIKYGRKVKGGFTLYDLRHTFNTNMRKAGAPESVIVEITDYSTREMFVRYNSIDEDDTRKAVTQLDVFFENVTQIVTQKGDLGKKVQIHRARKAHK